MVFTKKCNNAKHTGSLGRIDEIEDKYVLIEVLKYIANRYLFYHRNIIRNTSAPITIDYISSKSYFEDHQSYDHIQKLLEKLN